jgi:hypothetical protein
MSAFGPTRKSRDVRFRAAVGGTTDIDPRPRPLTVRLSTPGAWTHERADVVSWGLSGNVPQYEVRPPGNQAGALHPAKQKTPPNEEKLANRAGSICDAP